MYVWCIAKPAERSQECRTPSIFRHRGKIMIAALIGAGFSLQHAGLRYTCCISYTSRTTFDANQGRTGVSSHCHVQKLTVQLSRLRKSSQWPNSPQRSSRSSYFSCDGGPSTAAQDVEERMKSAKILVYEDTPTSAYGSKTPCRVWV